MQNTTNGEKNEHDRNTSRAGRSSAPAIPAPLPLPPAAEPDRQAALQWAARVLALCGVVEVSHEQG